MYDALTTSYRFACPVRGEALVRLSAFRNLQRLPGPAHPTVYRVRFECPCGYAEDKPRPIFPSAFIVLAPATARDLLALAVGCPSCGGVSVNIVSSDHVDLPFHNDPQVAVVPHVFEADVLRTVEAFRAELYSDSFDLRRLHLD